MHRARLTCGIVLVSWAVVLTATVASTGEQAEQPWRAAFDPEGVAVEASAAAGGDRGTLLAEYFSDDSFPPAGWGEAILFDPPSGPDPDWSRAAASVYPPIGPYS